MRATLKEPRLWPAFGCPDKRIADAAAEAAAADAPQGPPGADAAHRADAA